MKIYKGSNSAIKNWQWGDPGLVNNTRNVLRLIRGKPLTALDVGCGTGRLSLALAERGISVDAIDCEAKVIGIARTIADDVGAQIRFFEADFSRGFDCLQRKQYDLVVCTEVLEHVEEYARIVDNVFSVLRPGGQFIVSVPHDPRQYSLLDRHAEHLRRFTIPELKTLLRKFVINDCITIGFPLMRFLVAARVNYMKLFRKVSRPEIEWAQPSVRRKIMLLVGRLTRIDNLFNHLHLGTNIICSVSKPGNHAVQ